MNTLAFILQYEVKKQTPCTLFCILFSRENNLFDIPKDKKDYMDAEVKSDTCAFAIYPDLLEIEEAGTGTSSQLTIIKTTTKNPIYHSHLQISEPLTIIITTRHSQ